MIDFTTVKGITIPEGEVTKITDASGRVLWNRAEIVKVTIQSTCNGINGDTASITITSAEPFAPDQTKPNETVTTWTAAVWEEPNGYILIPAGSTIACTVNDTKQSNRCYVTVNGEYVLQAPGTYIHTVTGDTRVQMSDTYEMGEYGMINISG